MIFTLFRKIIFSLILVAIGVAGGAYLFSGTQSREFLKIKDCSENCFETKELLGLLTSIGLNKFPDWGPEKIAETDKTVAIKHPTSKLKNHYVLIPKKDIKNIADISEADKPYILDALDVIQKIIKEKNLTKYQVVTNGPGYQDVTYLHFHLVSD